MSGPDAVDAERRKNETEKNLESLRSLPRQPVAFLPFPTPNPQPPIPVVPIALLPFCSEFRMILSFGLMPEKNNRC
jgi:hypothetical protein